LPAIDRLLTASGTALGQVDGFVISAGPGSFTGLRIGMSTVKGLALASGKPVVAVPTLDVLAEAVPRCRLTICAILDARKKEVYAATYRRTSAAAMNRESNYMVLPPSDLARTISQRTLFVGNGIDLYEGLLREILKEKALFASGRFWHPRAVILGRLGLRRLACGDADKLDGLEPLYIRPSEAEIKKASRT
jgi:tRNA threonylcarbamoyladenosine biosynthesis protein TsaB